MSKIVKSSLETAVKGTTLVFIGAVVSMLLWFFTKILIIRNTTMAELGIYSLVIATVSITSIIAGAGLTDGITKFVSIFLGEGKTDDAEAVSKSSLQIGLLSSITASVSLYLLSPAIAVKVFFMPELVTPLRVVSFLPVLHVFSGVLVGILRGYGHIRPKVYFLNIAHPLFLLIILGAVFVLDLPFIGLFYAYLLALIAVNICMASYGYLKMGFNPFALAGGRFSMNLLRFSAPLLGTALIGMIFTWTDTFMLGRYTGAENVGVYNVSMSLAKLIVVVLSALGFVFMPIAGEMYARGQMAELKRTYQVLTRWVFSATLPLLFILLAFPVPIISSLFGERYVVSSGPLSVLLVGFSWTIFIGPIMMLMIILGKSRQILAVACFSAIFNGLLNYVFIKQLGYGVMGASTATMISMVVGTSVFVYILYSCSGFHPFSSKHIKSATGALLVGAGIYAASRGLSYDLWTIPLYLTVFIGGYAALILLSRSIGSEDVEMFEAVSQKTGINAPAVKRLLERFATK